MFMAFVDIVTNPQMMALLLSDVAAFATIISLGLPYLSPDSLASRMKSVNSLCSNANTVDPVLISDSYGATLLFSGNSKVFLHS